MCVGPVSVRLGRGNEIFRDHLGQVLRRGHQRSWGQGFEGLGYHVPLSHLYSWYCRGVSPGQALSFIPPPRPLTPAGVVTAQVVPWLQGLMASPGTSSVVRASAGTCAAWVAGLAKACPWAPPGLGFDLPSLIAPVVVGRVANAILELGLAWGGP